MKKTLFMLVLLTALFLTGCGYSKDEKAQMRKYEQQAKENAVAHIKNKYGFDSVAISTEIHFSDNGPIIDFTPSPNGIVTVTLKSKDFNFDVIIRGDEVTNVGKDNYQSKEIERDVLAYIKTFTKVDPIGYSINHSDVYKRREAAFIDYKYDISMLDSIMTRGDFTLVLEYLDGVDLELLKDNFELKKIKKFAFVKYKSRQAFDKNEVHDFHISNHPFSDYILDSADILSEALYREYNEEIIYHKFD